MQGDFSIGFSDIRKLLYEIREQSNILVNNACEIHFVC